jgi:hypothetical protein
LLEAVASVPHPVRGPPTTGVTGFCVKEKLGELPKVWVPVTITVIVALVTVMLKPVPSELFTWTESVEV